MEAIKHDNQLKVLQFPLHLVEQQKKNIKIKPSTSKVKSDGVAKPNKADPIRSIEDIHKIQDYFLKNHQYRDYCIFTMGISFGIRAGDLLNLKIGDIINDYVNIYEQKTGKFNRPYITDKVRNAINLYLSCRGEISADDYLFASRKCSSNGELKGISISALNRILKKAAKECDVKGNISSHTLRKTFAYQMLSIYEYDEEARMLVQSMLNHSDMRVTMRYAGLQQEKQDDMRMKLDDVI